MLLGAALGKIRRIPAQNLATLVILVMMVIFVSLFNPLFLSWSNLNGLMQQVAAMGIISLGLMIVISSGGLDFTAGNGVATAGVFGGMLYALAGETLLAVLFGGMFAGLVIGCINGLIISRLKIQPFVATLAMMSVCKGMTLFISEGKQSFLNSPAVAFFGSGQLFNVVPMPFFVFLVMCCFVAVLLHRTKFGIYALAIGDNEEAADHSGINIKKYTMLIYLFSGLCTGIAAAITISRMRLVAPNIAGTILLDAVAATVIGGTSIRGGRCTVIGTIMGVFIIGIVSNMLTFLDVPAIAQEAVKGLVIVIALSIDAVFNKSEQT